MVRLTDLKIDGLHLNLDGGVDSRHDRKAIFTVGFITHIKENSHNRGSKGQKRLFDSAIHALQVQMERTFAWENKSRWSLLQLESIQRRH
jgi:hypothetical protein